MLVRMLYVSRSVGPQTTTMTSSILAEARGFNAQHGITGVLCQGQGCFIQVLEGERSTVNQLCWRIARDSRHKDVEVVLLEDAEHRRFGQWSMAHVRLSNRGLLGQAADHAFDPASDPAFDPYAMSGRTLLVRLDALIASGHLITNVVA